ncbi:MAG TPA: YlxR family protein [Clostridia bacterium]|nr:MAG: hypothetical protein BWY62_00657 [Firmicutes bacterium ADurb.Bin356]HOF94392.1 YlxR family protein [Clostridia bacterium]HOR12524.1 YlxR family protein [Clostridia bacterium]
MAAKKIPMRMCIGCRQMRPKRELVRVVRSGEGKISLDPTGRAPGRGAYLCRDGACLERAMKSRALERSFEQKIDSELYEKLHAEFLPNA